MEKIRIGISACLLGEPVRWNGRDKRSALCVEELGRQFDLLPFCPEVGIGLGVPREPIHLVGEAAAPRARAVDNAALDVTERLRGYVESQFGLLQGLSGYIFIKGSPSCGLQGVTLHNEAGEPRADRGRGIFAAELCRRLPHLPVEEAGRLEQDKALRDCFLARVRACHDWREVLRSGYALPAWSGFHAVHAERLPAYEREQLAGLLGHAARRPDCRDATARQYYRHLQRALLRGGALCY